ncbi:MAG: hypothetical protein IPJ35_05230 [Elusimicrobia bacterium]|nr:hypothetical protein [Elusimicrobiota bacterium]
MGGRLTEPMDCWDLLTYWRRSCLFGHTVTRGLQRQWKNRRHPFRFYRFEDNEIPLMASFSMGMVT